MMDSTFKDPRRANHSFTRRAVVAALLALSSFGVVIARLIHLQIFKREYFSTLSEDNRVKVEPLPPTRGLIYDRNGVLLADNTPSFSLVIIPGKVTDIKATIAELSQLVTISDNDRARFTRLLSQHRRFDGVPIRLDLNELECASFAVHGHLFPGVEIRAELLRHYPFREHTAHVLGYVGRINENEAKKIDKSDYAGTSHIGKTGVEKAYENLLHGEVGHQQVEVNARGRVLRTLNEKPPVSGHDLHLFLDIDLQIDTAAAMAGQRGAVVAIDPNTGGVLAMVSMPSFDPNPFVGGIGVTDYVALRDNIDRPLYNRAVRGQYPPASTIKPFIGLGGLVNKNISFTERRYCGGYYQLPGHGHKYRCWRRGGHGTLTMEGSIVESCDVYFYRLAHDMGVERLDEFLAHFGFGNKTGIDFADELGGLLPSPAWKQRVRREPWFPGETLILGIGQGAFLVTPLQLAAATAAMANHGHYLRPRMVATTRNPTTGNLEPTAINDHQIPVTNHYHWKAVIEAMAQVVEGPRGTAKRIRSPYYRIAGKTGTAQVFTIGQNERYNEAQVAERMRDHALFIAFAPVEHPQIAVAVIVENGRHGGSAAAPVARQVIDSYLLKRRSSSNETPATDEDSNGD
ncbi:penicillin-binding protein 2 [Thiospirillum jenense]|uniref:Peptidoglycan D,D-transpeptidase MrdA n=1 Tax=Thiospirillum jenense TaxID=1653858 RepID=A0A839HEN6_9GAMM|nr:penicillin-binding protein 2 [Thiospirillum jenense]MBB1127121.1 penicillin-binding protein 2 [Thiospirillum jenense]